MILEKLFVSLEREKHMIMTKASMNLLTIVNHISIRIQLKKCAKHYVRLLIYYTQPFNETGGAILHLFIIESTH
jgi:hypothetical protein